MDAESNNSLCARSVIDCHAHIIDPARFPFIAGTGYTPKSNERGTPAAFATVLDAHGIERAVLVQPSCYGTDNSAMMDAMRTAPDRFKGIAVVEHSANDRVLDELATAGVVGVRFNLASYDATALSRPDAPALLSRIRELGWLAQVFAHPQQWLAAAQILRRAQVKTLVDHFGGFDPAEGTGHAGFQAVLQLGLDGLAVIKLSAPFRLSHSGDDYRDLNPAIAALVRAFGIDRCIWGSDWPFLGVRPKPSYRAALSVVGRWLPNPVDQNKVLWENPLNIFGFGA